MSVSGSSVREFLGISPRDFSVALDFLVVQDVEALIDTGALITGMSNVEVDGVSWWWVFVGLKWSQFHHIPSTCWMFWHVW